MDRAGQGAKQRTETMLFTERRALRQEKTRPRAKIRRVIGPRIVAGHKSRRFTKVFAVQYRDCGSPALGGAA
jgi:hypothetical protein